MKKERIKRIKKAITKKPYVFYFIGIFLLYIAINLIVNKLYVNLNVFTSLVLWFRIPFILFGFFIIPFLVALTITLSILRFKEAGFGKHTGASGLGIFAGVFGGACPGCFVGLFPAFLGLFGITASLSVLPLFGLEIQFLSAVFLIIAIHLLTKKVVCEIPLKNK